MDLIDSIIGVESGGDPNARNPNSSASGLGQFTDSTWLNTIRSARPDIADGKSDSDLLALKSNPDLSRQMTGAYAAQNQAILAKAGVPVTDGTTYLAHFAGPGGAVKVLQADPNASVGDILGPAVVKANPFLKDMTAQGLQAWAAKKMGVQAPTPGIHNSAPPAPASPTNAIPQQPAPVFAQQATQAAPQAPQAPTDFAPVNAPPIFAPPRKPVSLAGLMAAFKAPTFSRG